MVWLWTLGTLWFYKLDVFQEFISSTKRPYAKEMETVDFKEKLEETKGQINESIKDLTDGKYLFLTWTLSSTLSSHELSAKHQLEHLEASSDVFSRRAKLLFFQPIQTCGWIPGHVLHHLTLGRNSWCFHSHPPGWAPQRASNREWLRGSHWPLSQSGNETSVYWSAKWGLSYLINFYMVAVKIKFDL